VVSHSFNQHPRDLLTNRLVCRSQAQTLAATLQVVLLFPDTSVRTFKCQFSAALALSSGTLGAAMSSSLCQKRSIALSYGIFLDTTPTSFHAPANELACRIIHHLWDNWGSDGGGLRQGEVDLYSVNIPMIQDLLVPDRALKVCWTTLWRNSYGRLFEHASKKTAEVRPIMFPGLGANDSVSINQETRPLLYKWSPDLDEVIQPTVNLPPVGSDAWTIDQGWASVTPFRAAFADSNCAGEDAAEGSVRELKL
jgi:tubulin--tyrosine ligase